MNHTQGRSPIPTAIVNHPLPMDDEQTRYKMESRSQDLRQVFGMNQTALLRTTNGRGFRQVEDGSTVVRKSPHF